MRYVPSHQWPRSIPPEPPPLLKRLTGSSNARRPRGLAAHRAPGTVALVVTANYSISDMDGFVASRIAAAEGAREDFIITLGTTPGRPPVETRDSLVQSDGVLTTVMGPNGFVVVATPDAVRVTSRERSDTVKNLVGQLKAGRQPRAEDHLKMYRPWGSYQRIDIGSRFE